MQLAFATRPSALARWQTRWVMEALQTIFPELICKEKIITTQGDRILDKPLPEIGGKGLFTAELEYSILYGDHQVAVHSLKDLPVENAPGLMIGAIPIRGSARDVLVSADGFALKTLPKGARIGTSSLRRASQMLILRPDVKNVSIRGNVDTRINKLLEGQYDAIILAGVGLKRLGLDKHISQWLSIEQMLPAPGQGALAVQCRADDVKTLQILAAIDDENTRAAVTAEREFLYHLGGGCSIPVGAYAEPDHQDKSLLRLVGRVTSPDGQEAIQVSGVGTDPVALGQNLGEEALGKGAANILKGKQ